MCGICGIVALRNDIPIDQFILKRMNSTIRHRGPDDAGYYTDPVAGLAMRRLSIIDLNTGHQPIANEDGSIWIIFNGEIYNYRELRQRLEQKGHIFSTQTDTETIVHAYEEYGDDCVHHLNGMFAFAIWDKKQRRLLLARDRLGIKPLYYYVSPQQIIFGSELKAVMANPTVPRDIDFTALDQFLSLEYVPTPRSIFQHVKKLPPGHCLILEDGQTRLKSYWNVAFRPDSVPKNDRDCLAALTDLIRDAVKIRLVADVPLGAFLSGGIDSSTIVAFMSETADTQVRTFSIGFGDPTYNELPYARLVANHFNTSHYEAFLQPDITELVPRLVGHFDEPFADFSSFPTFLVSELASRQVKVVLSGDGGDEIFGGYDTYLAQKLDASFYSYFPRYMRQQLLPRLLAAIPPRAAKKGLINKSKRFVEGAALDPALQHVRWMMFMHEMDKAGLYHPDLQATLNGQSPEDLVKSYFRQVQGINPLAQQQYVDVKTYLVDDILTKVDRMSMATSLEARVPLLDYRLVEFALNLPTHLKLNGRNSKAILRQVMTDRLPSAVLAKPKEGFSIPIKHWLRHELRPLMYDLLSPDSLKKRGYFDPDSVAGWMQEHQEQKANHSHRLWSLMVLELWHRQMIDNRVSNNI
jgi:asparagine synthase (glutamine-hydrolysing)